MVGEKEAGTSSPQRRFWRDEQQQKQVACEKAAAVQLISDCSPFNREDLVERSLSQALAMI
jgi:hypothetical protein